MMPPYTRAKPNSSCGAGAEPAPGIPNNHAPGSFELNGEFGWATPSTTMAMPTKPAAPAPSTRRDPRRRLCASRVRGARRRGAWPRPRDRPASGDTVFGDTARDDSTVDGTPSGRAVSVGGRGVGDGVESTARTRVRMRLFGFRSAAGAAPGGDSSATTGPSVGPSDIGGAGVSRAPCSGVATRSWPRSRARLANASRAAAAASGRRGGSRNPVYITRRSRSTGGWAMCSVQLRWTVTSPVPVGRSTTGRRLSRRRKAGHTRARWLPATTRSWPELSSAPVTEIPTVSEQHS